MSDSARIVVINNQGKSLWAQLAELLEHRELVTHLALKDVKVRYKQTVIGIAWAVLQPFLTMIVFTLFFGKLAGVPSDDLPYPVFYMSALLPWTYFSNSLTQGTISIIQYQNMIKKVYFPRLALPLSAVMVGLVDLAIGTFFLFLVLFYYGFWPSWTMLFAPVFVLFAVVTAAAVTIWLSALNAMFRDIKHAMPMLIQLWMFVSPVAYGTSLVPEKWQRLYALNPMTTVIDGFRWSFTGHGSLSWENGLVSLAIVLILLVTGLMFFRKMEGTIADIV